MAMRGARVVVRAPAVPRRDRHAPRERHCARSGVHDGEGLGDDGEGSPSPSEGGRDQDRGARAPQMASRVCTAVPRPSRPRASSRRRPNAFSKGASLSFSVFPRRLDVAGSSKVAPISLRRDGTTSRDLDAAGGEERAR